MVSGYVISVIMKCHNVLEATLDDTNAGPILSGFWCGVS